MNWFESLIYGLISGLTELIPVSSSAHQYLLLKIFGYEKADPLLNALIHIAIIVAIYIAYSTQLMQLRQSLSQHSRRRSHADHTYKFINAAAIPLGVCMILLTYIFKSAYTLANVAVFCLLNGIVLFISGRALQGNKDASSMSSLDAGVTGLLGAFSVLPGISRTGVMLSWSIFRGADKEAALRWTILLSVPALFLMTAFDVIELFTAFQAMPFAVYLGYLLAIGGAYLGASAAIALMRFLAVRAGFAGFAYYSWGAALFAYILYLI